MTLPAELEHAIAHELASIEARSLTAAAGRLIERYKRGEFSIALSDPADHAAYLATRFPATYAASCKAFGYVQERLRDQRLASLLDLGAGAGAAMWAAAETFTFEKITCVEHNRAFAAVGQRLAATSGKDVVRAASWLSGDIRQVQDLPAHDAIVLSYVLGEVSEPQVEPIIRAAWAKAASLLVVIGPGTPEGFRRVHGVRALLLESGAHIIAPCPHDQACPMLATGDWCHFAARLDRTAVHRRLKSGSLGYEDEKFSYIAASKRPIPPPASRVLRHPLIRSGHMRLTLCGAGQPEQRIVAKSDKSLWRYARRLQWGDAWQPVSDRD